MKRRQRSNTVRGQREEHRSDDALAEQRSTSRRGEMMKRTEKSKANSRQSKPKDCDRDKAKYEENYEEKHTTEEKQQSARPEASKNRCKCPAGAAGAKRAEASRRDREKSQRSTSTWSTRGSSRQLSS